MIESLNKNYKIAIDNYFEHDNGIVFTLNGCNYFYLSTVYDEDYLNMLADITLELKNRIKLHEFVLNKDGKILSDGYVLLKMHGFIDEIDLNDVRKFIIPVNSKYHKYFVNMIDFWHKKIDYLELQVIELCNNKLINNSFDYYLGIAEMLLIYLGHYNNNYDLYLSHKVFKSLSNIDFYNPLNITFDSKYRDLAYYIRISNDSNLLNEVIKYVSKEEYNYFFVRLVFPFEYFEALNNVLVDKKQEKELVNIINNIDNYENWIKEIEDLLGIHIFNWLKKEVKW